MHDDDRLVGRLGHGQRLRFRAPLPSAPLSCLDRLPLMASSVSTNCSCCGGGQSRQRVAPDFRRGRAHGLDGRLDFFGQEHALGATVAGMAFAAHPAFLFHAVEQPAERRLLHFEDVRQLGLGHAIIAEQMIQHPPLRARQAECLHAPVESRAHQPGDIVQDEAEIA